MNQRPVGYLSKGQEIAVGIVVCALFVALMAAFVAYLVSIA